jgi:hypothetical protein
VCGQLLLVNSSWLQCTIGPAHVGRYPVTVSLSGQNSTTSHAVSVDRLCGEGRYALPGQPCGPCPTSARCVGLFPVPLPLPGFYPLTLTQFSACVPMVACAGVDAQMVDALVAQLRAEGSGGDGVLGAMLTQFMGLWNSTSNATVGYHKGVVPVMKSEVGAWKRGGGGGRDGTCVAWRAGRGCPPAHNPALISVFSSSCLTIQSEVEQAILRDNIMASINVSSSKCSAGYRGAACSLCSAGFYRLANEVSDCWLQGHCPALSILPSTAWMLIAPCFLMPTSRFVSLTRAQDAF